MKVTAVVPAGGSGIRLKKRTAKPFVKINGIPLIVHTLRALAGSGTVDNVIVAVEERFIARAKRLFAKSRIKKPVTVVAGGKIRSHSVRNALAEVKNDTGIVLVHDCARPCVGKDIIADAVKAAKKYGAACVSVPVKPTIKLVRRGFIDRTLDRRLIWEAQTPQAFRRRVIVSAYRPGRLGKATDDAVLAEGRGFRVKAVPGSYGNIKVTTAEDLVYAGQMLKKRKA